MSRRTRPTSRSTLAALVVALGLSACLTPPPDHVDSPERELEALLTDLRDLRGGDFARAPGGPSADQAAREGRITRAISRLALVHPRNVPVLVANASLSYERGDAVGAQKLLDQALAIDPTHRQATLLRVRIAAEAGNLPYARRKLDEQLELAPDDPDLREARAGVLHLLGDDIEALYELEHAARLRGDEGPTWLNLYHRGLVTESLGDPEGAQELYRRCLEENPEFEPASRRWRWLSEGAWVQP